MNANSSLIDRAGLDRVRVGKLMERGLEGADDGELFLDCLLYTSDAADEL